VFTRWWRTKPDHDRFEQDWRRTPRHTTTKLRRCLPLLSHTTTHTHTHTHARHTHTHINARALDRCAGRLASLRSCTPSSGWICTPTCCQPLSASCRSLSPRASTLPARFVCGRSPRRPAPASIATPACHQCALALRTCCIFCNALRGSVSLAAAAAGPACAPAG
jgi:hypothetical protein